ncbi:MAG TPA: SURF1 family protein [Steroidobacteraceae bacterium]|nr:SURF1 family protein [Steroidobacteraceae bacterium]
MFAPSAGFTVAALLLCALFIRLGVWQWHKGIQRQEEWTRFARGADRVIALDERAVSDVPLYQRVSVTGRLDGARQFLLDNRTYRGRAGYEVLTPLRRAEAAVLLIDRGWVPFSGTRARLPDISLEAAAPVTLSGRVAQLPSPGLASGRAAPDARAAWPKVTSYPSVAQLSAALGAPLATRIVLLDPQAPFGYLRDWQPPGMAPLRHLSYAIQWWCFAGLALIVWAIMSTRRNHAAASA